MCVSVCLSAKDNSIMHRRMSTELGRHGQGVTLWWWLIFDVDPILDVYFP